LISGHIVRMVSKLDFRLNGSYFADGNVWNRLMVSYGKPKVSKYLASLRLDWGLPDECPWLGQFPDVPLRSLDGSVSVTIWVAPPECD
jgi:hypothetical protein